MAIDRSEDDSSPTVLAQMRSVKTRLRRAAPGGNHDPGSGIVDGQDRTAYHLRHREVVQAEFLAAARERWNAAKPALETEWREYARAHPAVGDVSATLDDAAITKVKKDCDRIAEAEDSIVTPTMLIEAADPERHLVGLEHRRKGQDRIMEKVARQTEAQADLTPEEAVASVKDAAGFELVELRNSWKG